MSLAKHLRNKQLSPSSNKALRRRELRTAKIVNPRKALRKILRRRKRRKKRRRRRKRKMVMTQAVLWI